MGGELMSSLLCVHRTIPSQIGYHVVFPLTSLFHGHTQFGTKPDEFSSQGFWPTCDALATCLSTDNVFRFEIAA